jgi:hypothetical protein
MYQKQSNSLPTNNICSAFEFDEVEVLLDLKLFSIEEPCSSINFIMPMTCHNPIHKITY